MRTLSQLLKYEVRRRAGEIDQAVSGTFGKILITKICASYFETNLRLEKPADRPIPAPTRRVDAGRRALGCWLIPV